MRRSLSPWLEPVIVSSVMFVGLAASSADATSISSGAIRWGTATLPSPYGEVDVYLASGVSNDSDIGHFGQIQTNAAGKTYGDFVALPSGYLRLIIAGYRDGGLCGQSNWIYNTLPNIDDKTSALSDSVRSLCDDPDGNQSFSTAVAGGVLTGDGYADFAWQWSPVVMH